MRVTQRDIAEKAGVSQVTVSQVLHRSQRARISSQTEQDIIRIAQQMGYQPRSLTTHTISVVVEPDSLWHDATTNVLTFADELLHQHGYRMSVSTLPTKNPEAVADLFNQKAVDGVIFTNWCGEDVIGLQKLPVPWVLLADADDLATGVEQVGPDTVETARRLTQYLIERGHENIGVLIGPENVGFNARVQRGVYQAFQEAGLPRAKATVVRHKESGAQPEEWMKPMLRGKFPLTAILTAKPGGALVILNRLLYYGFRVPEDVSLVSLVDSPRLEVLKPAVTSTTMLGRDTMQLAVERLLQRIKKPRITPQCALYPGEIVDRESVADLRK